MKNSSESSRERKKKKLKEKYFLLSKKQRTLLLIGLGIAALIIILFGAKILLYLNFLLGNDIIIKLSSSSEALALASGETKNISFAASVTTNPFCKTRCDSEFEDISRNITIDKGIFTLTSSSGYTKDYNISKEEFGTGQKLYRFSMECRGVPTFFCHTSDDPTERKILVAVNYELSDEEKQIKNSLKQKIEDISSGISQLESEQKKFNETILQISAIIDDKSILEDKSRAESSLESLESSFLELENIWKSQDYRLLLDKATKAENDLKKARSESDNFSSKLLSITSEYNALEAKLDENGAFLEGLKDEYIPNEPLRKSLNKAIEEFNMASDSFLQKSTLETKRNTTFEIEEKISQLDISVQSFKREKTISLQIQQSLIYDTLCNVSGECEQHLGIPEISSEKIFGLKSACESQESLKLFLKEINDSMANEYASQGYPETENFTNDVSAIAKNLQNDIIRSYILQLNESSANYETLAKLLKNESNVETGNYSQFNMTPALIAEISKTDVQECESINLTIIGIDKPQFKKIIMPEIQNESISFVLAEPIPRCCVFGDCKDCCSKETCRKERKNYPIIFLHGHAFNKDISAEYSIDAFNKLQKGLEDDGYLNAGAVSLYTKKDVPQGIWNPITSPLSIKASYYYDSFGEQQNYVFVQTKSENIDTYAIRLKEIIDNFEYRQESPKVIIIAHSMGGLVARRYIDLFGEDKVERLILIGTPNNGIEGSTVDYCMLLGEKLECRDLTAGSVFLSKLNSEPLPNMQIDNIIGVGCSMNGQDGDGVVLSKSSYLEGKNNYYINGSCSALNPLHTGMLDTSRYPEVLDIIRKILVNETG